MSGGDTRPPATGGRSRPHPGPPRTRGVSDCVDSGCGVLYSPAAGAVISFSCQGSTPGSERTSGWLVDSSAGDFAATRCGLSRNAKKPTTAAKPSARAIAAMPNFKKGSPAIRRLISRTLKLPGQTHYPLNDPSNKTNPPPIEHPNTLSPIPLILSPTRMQPFYTPQKPQRHIPDPTEPRQTTSHTEPV